MADSAQIIQTKDALGQFYQTMLDHVDRQSAALARDIYRIYQNAQRRRWMTENASEGQPWVPLSEIYQKRKLVAYAGFPGRGSKMLIATGALVASVTGSDLSHHRRVIDRDSMYVATTIEYAHWVDRIRPFMNFSKKTIAEMRDRLKRYYMAGD